MRILIVLILGLIKTDDCIGKKPPIEWTPELRKELMELYWKIPPDSRSYSEKIKFLWDQKFPQYRSLNKRYLLQQANKVLESMGSGSERRRTKKTKWNSQLNADLLHIYNHSASESRIFSKTLERYWRKMHPELAHCNGDNLRKRAAQLTRQEYIVANREAKRARIKFETIHSLGNTPETDAGTSNQVAIVPGAPSVTPESTKVPDPTPHQYYMDDPIHSPLRDPKFLQDYDSSSHHIINYEPLQHHESYMNYFDFHSPHASSQL